MRTRLWVRATIFVLLGLYFLDTLVTGKISWYVNQNFQWLAGFAGIAFLVLGSSGMIDLLNSRQQAKEKAKIDQLELDPRMHLHGIAPSWLVLGVIAVPLALGILIPARPLGAAAVSSSGVTTSISGASNSSGGDAFSIPPEKRNLMDWMRAFGNSADLSEFDGQQADVTGFVYRDIRLDDKTQFFVMRFVVSCCVADASSLGLVVQTADAAKFTPDSWVQVKGTLQTKQIGDQTTPVLVAESIQNIPQPDHPYLYP